MPTHATDEHMKRQFAERGYVLVPQAASSTLIEGALRDVDDLIARKPPPADVRGPHFYWPKIAPQEGLHRILVESPTFALAQSLVGPWPLEVPDWTQVALNIPPFDHRPSRHHLDGAAPPEPDGRPGTFTLLVGIFLTDQPERDMGNLWVWPGTHRTHEAYFREHGTDVLVESRGYTPIDLPESEQIVGQAGDVLLAHYMLAHNIGGNTSPTTRRVVYFRLSCEGHRDRWRDMLVDALLEFEPVRRVMS